MSTIDDIRQTFFEECDELLESLDDGLCEIDGGVASEFIDIETVNSVFRAVHSIKGGAAAFGLEDLVQFAHQFETVLDAMRSNALVPDDEVLKTCHRAADHLNDLVAAGKENREISKENNLDLIDRLAKLVPGSEEETEEVDPQPDAKSLKQTDSVDLQDPAGALGFVPLGLDLGLQDTPDSSERDGLDCAQHRLSVRFAPKSSLYASGNDAALLFRELAEMGELEAKVNLDALPPLSKMDPSTSYFSWELELKTFESIESVREVFEFVEGMCDLEITQKIDSEPDTPDGSRKVTDGSTASFPVNEEMEASSIPIAEPDETGAAASFSDATSVAAGQPKSPAYPREGKASADGPKATVRVNLELVDRLINMVGELVINQAVLTQCIDDAGLLDRGDLATNLAEFRNLARDIQESVMAIRAQSVKPLFQRMARIVREASELSGKDVKFVTEGEATEVDKTIIERLVDPLTHMIRNAVDHGLEVSDRRIASGKPPSGIVKLSAAHRSGRVLIEVTDDGAGIDRPKVFGIAVEKGLIPPDASLKDADIDNLLFLPGFSTAKEVSNLSGRGVGMDVVRSAIQKLGGRVSISSIPGRGTTMSISLPLTLAVLDGMVVDVAGQTMVVPITAIVETLRPNTADIHPLGADNLVVAVRDKLVPVVDLGAIFGHRETPVNVSDMVLLLVESDDAKHWALAVDQIFDQRQVVIKGLETNYGHVPGVAAATILGDGNIALIIDPEETARQSTPHSEAAECSAIEEV